jgi:hypothetical protein
MKFGISFLVMLLTMSSVSASPIKIFYERDITRAETVKDIFTSTYQIPEDLIALKEVMSCSDVKGKGKLDLCLNDNGDLLVVSVDSGFISESLKIFRAP